MPETEQQDRTLSELVVKEAITKGMDSPMRESILEAVEESEGGRSGGRLPLAGALFGLGAALGFLAGRNSPELEESPIEDIEEPEIIEDVMETTAGTSETGEETTETDETGGGSSVLPRLLLGVGLLAGAAILRRRLAGDEEAEWEPIEEFEPATGGEGDEPEEAEAESGADEETEE
ncbi:hypothetical protein C488_05978 [Natrinema pellirubrum DSM 15624]|uniref:MYXO-CTERM domain-containing protein n=1 Tax=Natrinema pellirubrum (strain DSM 15624 / CIP 106293 / JCM 10476 / NCIMB 786 / 157) TaxID=797303 RepID=L0JKE3_NATP1|nr:hypothetical protein [Natrinema pellirubrum]AGB32010.1 hypothetical protein Natpe_2185 [Natrinema pellirubrum DSM 15624]ELY78123.1 hypothetical protein C488_05978 [Natrinema pellirubrum DSM 15624]